MSTIQSAVAKVQAAHEGWRQAMREFHEVALSGLADDGAGRPAILAAADVITGSTDAADAVMHLALLDGLAVVGVTVDS